MPDERPITFQREHLCQSMRGEKWQTRRVMNPQPTEVCSDVSDVGFSQMTPDGHAEVRGRGPEGYGSWFIRCPYGEVGDLLYPRCYHYRADTHTPSDRIWCPGTRVLTWRHDPPADSETPPFLAYQMDEEDVLYDEGERDEDWHGVAAHLMPKWASHVRFRITSVRVERVQEISSSDVVAEGVRLNRGAATVADLYHHDLRRKRRYRQLWNKLNAKRGHPWKQNDWVWVVEYEPAFAPPRLVETYPEFGVWDSY